MARLLLYFLTPLANSNNPTYICTHISKRPNMKRLLTYLFSRRPSAYQLWKQECLQGVKAELTQQGGDRTEIHSHLVALKQSLTGTTAPTSNVN